jgi:hypothetical protein
MFKPNQLVRRNPKIWRNDTALFKVIAVKSNVALVQRIGTDECPWTGKQVPHQPMTYEFKELVTY